jgi:Arc/MetJ-type ribon-helix-helix transcriptional regulator
MAETTTLTLKFKGVEASLLKQMVELGLFNTKSEAIRAALIKYAIDLNLLDKKTIWKEIQAHKKRKISPEQLAMDIQSIKDEI